MPNVHTRPLALRDEALHRAENWLTAFGALIPADQIENLAISLAADLAKPAIDEVERQTEQIASALALHRPDGDGRCVVCSTRRANVWETYPCATARVLGVTE